MRKIIYSVALAALAAFAATSCVKEDFSSGNADGEVEFTVSASLPGAVSTYGSEQGGINNVDNNSYKLRYILEVYTDEATPRLAYKTAKYADSFTTPVSFSARLLALDYNFVFWADFIPNDNAGTEESSIRTNDYIYTTNGAQGLQAITIADSRAAGTDVADAYYCVEEMDLTSGSVSKKDIRLRRPFGKIRLVATDKWDGLLQDNEPKLAEVAYSADLMVPSGFNALAKTALDESILAAGYEYEVLGRETVSVQGNNVEAYILGIDYIFASQDRNIFNFDVVTRDASGAQIGYREISNVPVAENKLTTVMGNFFTNEGTIEVLVDDEFDQETVVPAESIDVDASMDLAKIVAEAQPYTTINLAAGDYSCPNGIIINKPLYIYGDQGAVIKGSEVSYTIMIKPARGVEATSLAGTVLDGLTVYGAKKNNGSNVSNAIAIYASGTAEKPIIVRNCTTETPGTFNSEEVKGYNGIETTYGDLGYIIIEGNTINDTRYGMYFNSIHNSLIKGNTLNSTANGGITIAADGRDGKKSYDVTVEDNVLTDISHAGNESVYCHALGVVEPQNGVNLIQRNNTVTISETASDYIKNNPIYGFAVDAASGNLAELVRNLPDGGVLMLSEGVYEGNITFPEGKSITIKGVPGHVTVIKGQITVTSAGITAEDIVIENNSGYGIYSEGGSSIVARNCIFNVTPNASNNNTAVMTWTWRGIHAKVHISNCVFNAEGVRTVQLRGVADALIENTVFNKPYSYAVQIDEAGTNLVFRDNIVNDASFAIYVHGDTSESKVEQSGNTLNNVTYPYAARPKAMADDTNEGLEDFWYYVTSAADAGNTIADALRTAPKGAFIALTAGEYTLGTIQDKHFNFVGPNNGISANSEARHDEAVLKLNVYQPKTRPDLTISFDGVKIIQNNANAILFDLEGGANATVRNSVIEVNGPASKGLLYSHASRISANIVFEHNYIHAVGTDDVSMWIYGNGSDNTPADVFISGNTFDGVYLNYGLKNNNEGESRFVIDGNKFINIDGAGICLQASDVQNGTFTVTNNDFSGVSYACKFYSSYAQDYLTHSGNINWSTVNNY